MDARDMGFVLLAGRQIQMRETRVSRFVDAGLATNGDLQIKGANP